MEVSYKISYNNINFYITDNYNLKEFIYSVSKLIAQSNNYNENNEETIKGKLIVEEFQIGERFDKVRLFDSYEDVNYFFRMYSN